MKQRPGSGGSAGASQKKRVMENKNYTEINATVVDQWVESGWEWGKPIDHETFAAAKRGEWSVVLTPNKPVPKSWFCEFRDARILGLASGGGQQMPLFSALGAHCTVLDYSERQLLNERQVAERESYAIELVRADMTKPLPFENEVFDLIFHPVSNCYIQDVMSVWRECFRVLKKGGILLAGFDNGINFLFDEEETTIETTLPFNPLADAELYEKSVRNDWGIQFSHSIEEQIGGQLRAGFTLTDIYEDTNSAGTLHDHNAPTFYATRAVKG